MKRIIIDWLISKNFGNNPYIYKTEHEISYGFSTEPIWQDRLFMLSKVTDTHYVFELSIWLTREIHSWFGVFDEMEEINELVFNWFFENYNNPFMTEKFDLNKIEIIF